jgi:hypothetical protein
MHCSKPLLALIFSFFVTAIRTVDSLPGPA